MKLHRFLLFSCIFLLLALSGVSCIFSPDTGKEKEKPAPIIKDPTTTKILIENLQAVFNQLDADLYEKMLHEDFYYRSPSELDGHDILWTRTEEIETMRNLFENCKEFVLSPSEIQSYEEYGKNILNKPDGARLDVNNEHPDEIWYVVEYYIAMDIFFQDIGDFKVQQDMTFKMTEDPDTHLFSIIRWVDDNFND